MSADAMCHVASVVIDAPEGVAFDHLTDPKRLGRWTLGSMDMEPTDEPNVFRSRSLFDGSTSYVEIDAKPADGLIDFHVGNSEKRAPRVFVRIAPGPLCGLSKDQCTVALFAWRTADMSPERWRQLGVIHDAEILLFKAQIETDIRQASLASE